MTDIEFEYADYCINKLRESVQAADDIDWQNRKTHRYDDRLSNKEIEEVRAILVAEKWIERYQRTTMYSLNKSKLTILKDHGSYSNYCKFLDKENSQLKSSFYDKLQLETDVLKLQKENLEKSSKIRLDVFELVNRHPILNYRISVVDKVIISIDNKDITQKGASKVIDLLVREKLDISELTDNEKLDFGNQLTHKFKIKNFGKNHLFLNLTDNDLIKLGFKEKPKTRWQKLIDFSLNGFWLWLGRIGTVTTIAGAPFLLNLCSENKDTKNKDRAAEIQPSQTNSKINSKDTINVYKTDSLLKN